MAICALATSCGGDAAVPTAPAVEAGAPSPNAGSQRLSATISVMPVGRIFTAAELQAPPPLVKTISVTNGGSGTLSDLSVGTIAYGSGQPTGWLTTATLSGTTAPVVLSLRPTPGALVPGSYSAVVPLLSPSATNSPKDVAVTLNVTPSPWIAVSPAGRIFTAPEAGPRPANKTIAITNGSTSGNTLDGLALGTIRYGAGQPTGWLTTATLNSATAPATLTLRPTPGTLPAGSYLATVPVTSPVASNSPKDLTITLSISPASVIATNVTGRMFTAGAGGPNPAAKTIDITNGGSAGTILAGLAVGAITYGAGQPAGWLTTAMLNMTTAPAILTLRPSTGVLAPGIYTASVPLTSSGASNSPKSVSVTFTVNPAPRIATNVPGRTFIVSAGATAIPPKTITITNAGSAGTTLTGLTAGPVTYGGGEPTGWLAATLGGSTAPATLTLQPTVGSLTAGTYHATVPITAPGASNSPMNVTATMTVTAPAPDLTVIRSSFPIGTLRDDYNAQAVARITNIGGADAIQPFPGLVAVNFYVSTDKILDSADPLIGSNTDGFVMAPGDTFDFYFSYRCCTVPEGAYYLIAVADPDNWVTESNENNNQGVAPGKATFLVTPELVVDSVLTPLPIEVGLGAIGEAYVANTRAGKPNVPVQFFLSVDPLIDPATDYLATDPIFPLYASLRALSPQLVLGDLTPGDTIPTGDYYLGVVLDPGGLIPEIDKTNNVGVAPAPVSLLNTHGVLALSKDSVQFTDNVQGTNPPAQVVTVLNPGSGTLTNLALDSVRYDLGQTGGWLTTAQLNGTTITIQPTTGTLLAGIYGATVYLSAGDPIWGIAAGSPRRLRVKFDVKSPLGTIILSSNAVGLTRQPGGAAPAAKTVTITNSGLPGSVLNNLAVGTITYSGGQAPWLDASILPTSITTGSATLTLTPTRGDLPPGSFTATVPVTAAVASNSPQTVTVTFTVAGMAISSNTVTFPNPQGIRTPFDITNTGPIPLTGVTATVVSYGGGCTGWLTLSLGSAQAPTTLTIATNGGSVTCPPGTYTAVVRVDSPLSGNGPQDVSVTYIITRSFAGDVAPIFGKAPSSCFGTFCHSGGTNGTAPDLTAAVAHRNLVNFTSTRFVNCNGIKLVVPGSASASFLQLKVDATVPAGCGSRMPFSPTPMVSQTDRDIIRAWINEGAPNN